MALTFADIPKFPQARYTIHASWRHLESNLALLAETTNENGETQGGLVMDPDYQRPHVWTEEQQRCYVEYALQGGEIGRHILFNNPTWGELKLAPTELVDGKQRLEAVRKFLRDELKAFGQYCSEFGPLPSMEPTFIFSVCKMKTREEVLQLYLNLNAGGTPHSKAELERVRELLEVARKKS